MVRYLSGSEQPGGSLFLLSIKPLLQQNSGGDLSFCLAFLVFSIDFVIRFCYFYDSAVTHLVAQPFMAFERFMILMPGDQSSTAKVVI